MNAKDTIRYPVNYHHRHNCLFSLADDDGTILTDALNYVEARKQIYVPVYQKLVKQHPDFHKLQCRLKKGENLLIIEVDGPHGESMEYYKQQYNVDDDFITDNTILCTENNLNLMLNDTKHAFGHGYCLGAALLDLNLN